VTGISRVLPGCILLWSILGATAFAQAPSTLPSGNSGIASKYPGDANIKSDPAVLFTDDFESYTSASGSAMQNQLLAHAWTNLYHVEQAIIDTAQVYKGTKAFRFSVPGGGVNLANGIEHAISPKVDKIFVRAYTMFAFPSAITGSEHNGIAVTANYLGSGIAATGTNHFYVGMQNSQEGYSAGASTPGWTDTYIYYPGSRNCDSPTVCWGDHFFPNGVVDPFTNTPFDWGPYFVSRPQFTPKQNQWYSYELMVQANTPGLKDGRIAEWIDGNLIADYQNLRLRDVNTLKIDRVELDLYMQKSPAAVSYKWYDNVVVATSYIGPVANSSSGLPAPPTGLTAIVN